MIELLMTEGRSGPPPKFEFLGEVPESEFISGADLMALIGISGGNALNAGVPWLKFTEANGTTKYLPKMCIRSGISWNTYNNAGLIAGKIVSFGGKNYKVRMIGTTTAAGPEGYQPTAEWDRLFYSICAGRIGSYTGPRFAEYTIAELGFYANIWHITNHNANATQYYCRGNPLIPRGLLSRTSVVSGHTYFRPVLDVV